MNMAAIKWSILSQRCLSHIKQATKISSSYVRRQVATETERQVPRLRKVPLKRTTFGESGYILLVIPVAAFSLGGWQVQRRKWKINLIQMLEEKTTSNPVPLPDDLEEIKDMEYRRIHVRGTYDHSRERHIGPRSNYTSEAPKGGLISSPSQSGINVITPLKLADRDLEILVNRGYVPAKYKKARNRPEGQIKGIVDLVGIVRHTEKRRQFTPNNKPESGYLVHRDVELLAELTGAAPVFIDADSKSTVAGGPVGGQTRVSLRNEHMTYIVTWYALALITSWMWYKRYRRPKPPDATIAYMVKQKIKQTK